MDDNGGSGRPAGGRPADGGTGDGTGDGAGQWTVPGYTHERELGAGASGRVVLARHDATGTAVAVKYLTGRLGRDHRFRTAFQEEARLLGGLDSPYVARFYEYVEDGPGAAIVMELVDGIALRALLRQEGATGPEPALAVLKGSLLGLAAAHAAGVVHRDYKPANVLVTTDGRSKLVDFGVAVRSGESGGAAGTPAYMAPEQWAGGLATPATDVYAATATFYECLTGTKPFAGATMLELAVQHAEAPVPADDVPEPVRALVRRGLAKAPAERPRSAAEFVAELEAVASGAYGGDWEERGQRKLAALVALLPLLLPSSAGPASGTTALAHTRLGPPGGPAEGAVVVGAAGAPPAHGVRKGPRPGRRGRLPAGGVLGVLACAALAVTAVATSGGGPAADASDTMTPSALTSLTSGPPAAPATGAPGSASPPATASASPTASTSSPTDPPTTATATASAPAPTGTGATPTPTPTTPPTAPATTPPTTTAAPALHVSLVMAGQLSCSGSDGVQGRVSVRSDGAADGTLTLTWFHTDANGATTVVATDSVPLPAGRQSVSGTYTHIFGARDLSPTWGLTVSTSPAAAKGQNSSQTLSSSSCRTVIF